jgi:gamma-glutamylcysteine synthetase
MSKFVKKPIVIDAEIFQWGIEDGIIRYNEYIPKNALDYPEEMRLSDSGYVKKYGSELSLKGFDEGENWVPYIETLEGKMRISEGDYIITGIKGERYPCKPDIFEATYEAVED